MTAPEVRAGCEFRVAGRTLTGTVLRFGSEAVVPLPDGRVVRERFSSGAFAPLPDVPLVMQHDESLVIAKAGEYVLNDTPRAMTIRAELRADSAALQLVKAGALAGYSFRFWPKSQRFENGARIIDRARLGHVSLVDAGAYPDSIAEVRRGLFGGGRGSRGGRLGTFRGKVPASKALQCQCGPKGCFNALFKQKALRGVVDDEDEILAVWGDYAKAVGSKKRRTVRFWEGEDGALEFAVDIPNTPAGRTLKETLDARAVDVIGRPVIDSNASDFTIRGTTATYEKVKVRAITVGATDRSAGWPAGYLRVDADDDMPEPRAREDVSPEPEQRRTALWLL